MTDGETSFVLEPLIVYLACSLTRKSSYTYLIENNHIVYLTFSLADCPWKVCVGILSAVWGLRTFLLGKITLGWRSHFMWPLVVRSGEWSTVTLYQGFWNRERSFHRSGRNWGHKNCFWLDEKVCNRSVCGLCSVLSIVVRIGEFVKYIWKKSGLCQLNHKILIS